MIYKYNLIKIKSMLNFNSLPLTKLILFILSTKNNNKFILLLACLFFKVQFLFFVFKCINYLIIYLTFFNFLLIKN